MAILDLGKAKVAGSQTCAVEGLTDLVDAYALLQNLNESCIMGMRIVVMKLIRSLGHCECDGNAVHKVSQRRLTAE